MNHLLAHNLQVFQIKDYHCVVSKLVLALTRCSRTYSNLHAKLLALITKGNWQYLACLNCTWIGRSQRAYHNWQEQEIWRLTAVPFHIWQNLNFCRSMWSILEQPILVSYQESLSYLQNQLKIFAGSLSSGSCSKISRRHSKRHFTLVWKILNRQKLYCFDLLDLFVGNLQNLGVQAN